MRSFSVLLAFCLLFVVSVSGHGRLQKPPGRATLWRDPRWSWAPRNYDDTQLFCGGVQVQYELNGGKCGLCGDPWNDQVPRAHEGGGLYGRGIIVAEYKQGEVIDVEVDLTASHLGYFEFRLCPHNNPLVPATQECLDQYVLELADGSGTRYGIPSFDRGLQKFQLKLPKGVTCSQCVLQWHYNTGNSYGVCSDGSYELGCGNQEVFRSCADVKISA